MRVRLAATLLAVIASASALIALNASGARAADALAVTSLVSKGQGLQVHEGAGLTYGWLMRTPASAGTLIVEDLTVKGAPVKVTVSRDARLQRYNKKKRLWIYSTIARRKFTFKVSGKAFRVYLNGQSQLNGVGISGVVHVHGHGQLQAQRRRAGRLDGRADRPRTRRPRRRRPEHEVDRHASASLSTP